MDYVNFIIGAGIICLVLAIGASIAKAKERYDATHADKEPKSRFFD